jgi:hypothetical protein
MMTVALITVILWSISGYGDDIFPSVPGMGTAFITHFIMNQLRTSHISPLGRFELPDFKTLGIAALVIVAPITVGEAAYIIAGPDSLEEGGSNPGSWFVETDFDSEQLADGIEYINDGQIITIELSTDSLPELKDVNIVGARVTLTYSEDETSSGIGCNVPGASNPESDTITGTIIHDGNNNTSSGQNSAGVSSSHFVEVEWYDSSLIGNVTGVSKSDINKGLNAGDSGLGIYTLEINVIAESGGGIGCTNTDDGEEVEYLVELITLDYSINSLNS